jgi:hypothetical protein
LKGGTDEKTVVANCVVLGGSVDVRAGCFGSVHVSHGKQFR